MIGIVVGLAAEARLARRLGGRVAVGGGDATGAGTAALALAKAGVTGLVSFGLAGGLAPDLSAGALFVPEFVVAPNGVRWLTDPDLSARFGRRRGTMFASDAVIASQSGKREAFEATGAAAVDLESGAVARACATFRLPFAVLRAVCDPADQDLPPAALLALSGHGQIRLFSVLRSLARNPGQLPGLLRLGRNAAAARRALKLRVAATGPLE